MSDIIAGDPAPTNPTAAIRADILTGLRIAESSSVGDETPESLLAEYDALKRAEALHNAAEVCRRLSRDGYSAQEIAAHLDQLASLFEAGESRG
ncbi:hypothetical protein [Streptomyces goshikiensis]|uniref:hypothetical protein n=1 Tax=Streptomyces goshikiensis TaxID=1942 RepID=UPI0036649126